MKKTIIKTRRFFITTIILLCAVLFLYYFLVHPIICMLYIRVDVYTGVDVYQSEFYLQHEDGGTFKQFFTGLDFFEDGQVVDFYYGNNESHDNPIHGSVCDVFAIDIQLPELKYQQVLLDISTDVQYYSYPNNLDDPENEKWMPNGFVYWLPRMLEGDKCNFVYASNNKSQVVRVVMLTDTEDCTAGGDLLDIIQHRSLLIA